MKPIQLPPPDTQVDFSVFLATARKTFLMDALCDVVSNLDVSSIDSELALFVPADDLRKIASVGLRGELVFPVPIVLKENPRLLSYYRLLLGHSQKAFYDGRTGTASYKCMETSGLLPKTAPLNELCKELIRGLCLLIQGITVSSISRNLLDDLTLLTLGPQLRGGANVKKGIISIQAVFNLIKKIVQPAIKQASESELVLKNAAGRQVLIQFASDPDIVIREALDKNHFRNIIAIEVKGGTDFSNIHNRLGEAEKSHIKAKQKGYVECWTIVNVHRIDSELAKRESPSTNQFFSLSEIVEEQTPAFTSFQTRIISLTGISGKARRTRNLNDQKTTDI